VLSGAVQVVIAQQTDPRLIALMKGYDYRQVIDNRIVGRPAEAGFFESLFGARKSKRKKRERQNWRSDKRSSHRVVCGAAGAARHIIATGGAGSSGLPALASGIRTSTHAIIAITTSPPQYEGSLKMTGSGRS
jgi:hypothetical protein